MIKLSTNTAPKFVYEWSHTNPPSGVVATSFAHPLGTKDVSVTFYILNYTAPFSANAAFNYRVHDIYFSGVHSGIDFAASVNQIDVCASRINGVDGTFTIRAIVTAL